MKKMMIRGVILLGVLVAILVGSVYLVYRQTITSSLPLNNGSVSLHGIMATIEIVRDTYGVPHIYAQNEPDLYFALGYAMAQDRLWQMEFSRHLGQGRLSEIFGPEYVSVDRYFRTLTAGSRRKRYPKELQFIPRAFARGINAYLKQQGDRLPLEFKLLRFQPEMWQEDDYLAVFKLIAWQMSVGWSVDPTAAQITAKAGHEILRELFSFEIRPQKIADPSAVRGLYQMMADVYRLKRHIKQRVPSLSMPASNNWAVSGRKTATGNPLLANDTHLALNNPCMWWEAHLVCPGIDVSGFAIPGLPGIVMGHTPTVAWGITTVMVDDVDFYIEKLHPQNPRQYQYQGRWETFKRITETIQVKGGSPQKIEILVSRHGPVIDDLEAGRRKQVTTARWAYNDLPHPGLCVYLLAKARNADQVVSALRHWEVPGQNIVFADTRGNIGLWCCAAIPIREKGDGLLPAPGWTGEYEWQGYVPFERRPHLINPEKGYLATANHDLSRDGYPHFITTYWAPEARIERIRQMLSAKKRLTTKDMRQMQLDVYNPVAADIAPQLARILRQLPQGRQAKQAANLLSNWDYKMTTGSAAASIFEMSCLNILKHLYEDDLGEDLYRAYLDLGIFSSKALWQVFRQGHSNFADKAATPEKENLTRIITISLEAALKALTDQLGDNPNTWQWGRLHTMRFNHVMGERKFLDKIFNVGPYPVAGSQLTVNRFEYEYARPFAVVHGVSQRMIVDLDRVCQALHVLPTGESGLLASPHYTDQLPLYQAGRYHSAWTDQKDLNSNVASRLRLLPRD
jgi:penicillin amidase